MEFIPGTPDPAVPSFVRVMCVLNRSVMSYSLRPQGFTVHGIFQARILEWVTTPISRGSSPPRDRTPISNIVGGFFTIWAARESLYACDELATYCYCSHGRQSYLPLHIRVLVGSDEGLTSSEPALSLSFLLCQEGRASPSAGIRAETGEWSEKLRKKIVWVMVKV